MAKLATALPTSGVLANIVGPEYRSPQFSTVNDLQYAAPADDADLLIWLHKLAKPMFLTLTPIAFLEILCIAWSVAVHSGPEARQNFLDILAILGFIAGIFPCIEKIANKLR